MAGLVNLDAPVGTLTQAQMASMILRRTITKEECVALAQKQGACGKADDFCAYYSFTPGEPLVSTNSFFGGSDNQTGPGSCYMGPDETLPGTDSFKPAPYQEGQPNSLYYTPSSQGSTPEEVQLNTTRAVTARRLAKSEAKASTERKKMEAERVRLAVLRLAGEKGISLQEAQKEYDEQVRAGKVRALKSSAPDPNASISSALMREIRGKGELIRNVDSVLERKDMDVEQQKREREKVEADILRLTQRIEDNHHTFGVKDGMVKMLLGLLFALAVMAFLMFTYYGVKVVRPSANLST